MTENNIDKYIKYLDIWEKHEKVAMHFNDLILKVRIQAIGALAAIITIGGILIKTIPSNEGLPWGLLTILLFVLTSFWIAIWFLDFKYYNRLLLGSIDYLLKLEDQINNDEKIDLDMSHKIENAIHNKPFTHLDKIKITGPLIFYSIVFIVLFSGFIVSFLNYACKM
jgi:hypothetical protein